MIVQERKYSDFQLSFFHVIFFHFSIQKFHFDENWCNIHHDLKRGEMFFISDLFRIASLKVSGHTMFQYYSFYQRILPVAFTLFIVQRKKFQPHCL